MSDDEISNDSDSSTDSESDSSSSSNVSYWTKEIDGHFISKHK